MQISFWKIITIFSIVSNWCVQAMADGKVTLQEALSLVAQLAVALNLPTEFEVPKTPD